MTTPESHSAANPLQGLGEAGQSVWLDFLKRSFIENDLARMIETDGVKGVTSNPSIFEQAIGESEEYQDAVKAFSAHGAPTISQTYEHLAIADIKAAADVLHSVYEATAGRDGYVSLECSPYLANDTEATIAEAVHLWHTVDRPNLMVKIPATEAGLPAIRAVIGKGINVNVTLLFSVDMYRKVAQAYIGGLEDFRAAGGDVGKLASVASFFVSRIDAAIDKKIDALENPAQGDVVRGKVAIANAKMAYVAYGDLFAGPRWDALAAAGAHTQRLLWASTSTKSKSLKDTVYVEALVGKDTVNTIPPKTLDAFRDHGEVQADAITTDLDDARNTLKMLADLGIDLDEVCRGIVVDGVKLFSDAFDKLLGATARQTVEAAPDVVGATTVNPGSDEAKTAFDDEMGSWREGGKIRRLWNMDATLWTGADEAKWGGWLRVVDDQIDDNSVAEFAESLKDKGFTDLVLLGMGGSSLGPQVLAQVLGAQLGWPKFHMLDSTDPQQIADLEAAITLKTTVFITSSKSGSTLEPNIFTDFFWDRMTGEVGKDKVAQHFIAVTDPGSAMEKRAKDDNWSAIFPGIPGIGGRYSVLSNFGRVPAAAIGLDIAELERRTLLMERACGHDVPPDHNPGVQLGVALGVAAHTLGRDKVTIVTSPKIAALGAWLEQLLAESTGKQGHGLIPMADEPLGDPSAYGTDRIFTYVELASDFDPAQRAAMAALAQAGHPVVTLTINQPADIGQEFFRWEIAVAVAGAIIGIDPFDQPDVEASKIKTRALTDAYENGETPEDDRPIYTGEGMKLYADPGNAAALGHQATITDYLKRHFGRIGGGDYAALLAYIDRTIEATAQLTTARTAIRDHTKAATCVGFGPRFLHSTGQAYKGGPNTGVFLQITCDNAHDIPVPGHKYTFAQVKAAQAKGDLSVLVERGRRVIRIHLDDATTGLPHLVKAIEDALV
ncbi:bifunctional transaldolase/phosoglucose isomerase [Novosphingobium sp.]|uniref:bifunctional transaldolase/phosoglucose isomerase n=1 Tax=Novosphingobium sp. TaxID=1874826 RepID=UPI003B52AD92